MLPFPPARVSSAPAIRQATSHGRRVNRRVFGWLAALIVAAVSFAATSHIAVGRIGPPAPVTKLAREAERPQTPSAAEFGHIFVGTANQFAVEHGDPRRIGRPDCVQASPGRYMCSYTTTRPGAPRRCDLMQARWTPDKASTITVTLAGRTARCGSLREAIDSLP